MLDKNSIVGSFDLNELLNDTPPATPTQQTSLTPLNNKVEAFSNDEEIEPFNLAEAMGGIEVKYQRLKIPSGGGTVFEFGDQFTKQLEGVILLFHKTNSLYLTKLEDRAEDSDKMPDCSSKDGITGIEKATGEVKNCSNCPYNRFDSEIQCANKYRLYLQLSGNDIPVILDLPAGSLKAFSNFINESLAPKKLWSYQAVVIIELEKKENKNKQPYSAAKFTLKGQLQKAVALDMQRKYRSLKSVL